MPAHQAGIFLAFFTEVNYAYLRTAFALAAVLAATASGARADRSDFKVNDDGAAVEHSQPRIAVIPGKGFAVVWSDYRSGDRSIYIQRFTPQGDAIGGNLLVNTDTNRAYQAGPALGIDGTGHYNVVWQDYRDGSYPFGPHVYFQRFDSALAAVGSNRNLTVEKPDSLKEFPDIAIDAWGRGVVVWADYRNRNWDIYGQLISPTGALVGSNFKVNDDIGVGQQHAPRVSMSGDGWFVVTWYDNRYGSDDIFVQRFDTLGTRLGPNTRVNSDGGTARQAYPDVAADVLGHFTVVWTDWRNGVYPVNPDVYARKFDTLLQPLTPDIRVSTDGAGAAQRDPAVAVDRNGNVAIVWSDSSSSSWDVHGQMIDATGAIREVNFRANSFTDSAQLQPDVALDGRNRYVTWVDKRNGQFDIYASIVTYNNPTLTASPQQLQFGMDVSDTVFPTKSLIINTAGYNAVHFRAKSSVTWLTVNPASGLTPDTLVVAINQKLPYGSYYGALNFVDDDNHDSSLTISVRYDVTAPALKVNPDSLNFSALFGFLDTLRAQISVENAGSGQLPWTATVSVPWLSVNSLNGTAPSDLNLTVVPQGLDTGSHSGYIVFSAPGVSGSPDTVLVTLGIETNRSYVKVQPDSLHLSSLDTVLTDHPQLVVLNAGAGTLNWKAVSDQSWLKLNRTSGAAGDSIGLTFDWSQVSPGQNDATIQVVDSNAFNVSVTIPIRLDRLSASSDSIVIGMAETAPGDTVSVPLTALLKQSMTSLSLPIRFPDTLLQFDSVSVAQPFKSRVIATGAASMSPGAAIITCTLIASSDSIPPGSTLLGRLYFHSKSASGLALVAEDSSSGNLAELVTKSGLHNRPTVLAGQITVGSKTDVNDRNSGGLPRSLTLAQNYPNPFNSSTVIRFGLPSSSPVTLELYNVLGQRVSLLLNRIFPAGWHQVTWPGIYENGRGVPSGIYFYRLVSGSASIVRKLVVLK